MCDELPPSRAVFDAMFREGSVDILRQRTVNLVMSSEDEIWNATKEECPPPLSNTCHGDPKTKLAIERFGRNVDRRSALLAVRRSLTGSKISAIVAERTESALEEIAGLARSHAERVLDDLLKAKTAAADENGASDSVNPEVADATRAKGAASGEGAENEVAGSNSGIEGATNPGEPTAETGRMPSREHERDGAGRMDTSDSAETAKEKLARQGNDDMDCSPGVEVRKDDDLQRSPPAASQPDNSKRDVAEKTSQASGSEGQRAESTVAQVADDPPVTASEGATSAHAKTLERSPSASMLEHVSPRSSEPPASTSNGIDGGVARNTALQGSQEVRSGASSRADDGEEHPSQSTVDRTGQQEAQRVGGSDRVQAGTAAAGRGPQASQPPENSGLSTGTDGTAQVLTGSPAATGAHAEKVTAEATAIPSVAASAAEARVAPEAHAAQAKDGGMLPDPGGLEASAASTPADATSCTPGACASSKETPPVATTKPEEVDERSDPALGCPADTAGASSRTTAADRPLEATADCASTQEGGDRAPVTTSHGPEEGRGASEAASPRELGATASAKGPLSPRSQPAQARDQDVSRQSQSQAQEGAAEGTNERKREASIGSLAPDAVSVVGVPAGQRQTPDSKPKAGGPAMSDGGNSELRDDRASAALDDKSLVRSGSKPDDEHGSMMHTSLHERQGDSVALGPSKAELTSPPENRAETVAAAGTDNAPTDASETADKSAAPGAAMDKPMSGSPLTLRPRNSGSEPQKTLREERPSAATAPTSQAGPGEDGVQLETEPTEGRRKSGRTRTATATPSKAEGRGAERTRAARGTPSKSDGHGTEAPAEPDSAIRRSPRMPKRSPKLKPQGSGEARDQAESNHGPARTAASKAEPAKRADVQHQKGGSKKEADDDGRKSTPKSSPVRSPEPPTPGSAREPDDGADLGRRKSARVRATPAKIAQAEDDKAEPGGSDRKPSRNNPPAATANTENAGGTVDAQPEVGRRKSSRSRAASAGHHEAHDSATHDKAQVRKGKQTAPETASPAKRPRRNPEPAAKEEHQVKPRPKASEDMINALKKAGKRVAGLRLKVCLDGDDGKPKWLFGSIADYDNATGEHTIEFDLEPGAKKAVRKKLSLEEFEFAVLARKG